MTNPKDELKYVWIPPGTFMMGCSPGDSECSDDEKPPHPVTITKGFWMGQTDVTVAAYKKFAGSTGVQMPPEPMYWGSSLNAEWSDEGMPILNTSWNGAAAFCGWAGGRLPTEAEWEYAARAGSTEARYGPLDEISWYSAEGDRKPHEVARKRPNAWNLFDTLVIVSEWVNDWYGKNYYTASPQRDPQGPDSGNERVQRGGAWDTEVSQQFRVSSRSPSLPAGLSLAGMGLGSGVRCAREVGFPDEVTEEQPNPQGPIKADVSSSAQIRKSKGEVRINPQPVPPEKRGAARYSCFQVGR